MFILIGLCFLAGIADALFTLFPTQYIALESNPIFPIGIGWLMLFKFLVLTGICWTFYKYQTNPKYSNVGKYFYIAIIVILCIIQFYAAYNNYTLKNKIVDFHNTNYDTNYTVDSMPQEVVATYALPTPDAVKAYFKMVWSSLLFPVLFGCFCFVIYDMIHLKKVV